MPDRCSRTFFERDFRVSLYQRIACLCTESVETLYALDAQAHIVGISGFTVHPPHARKEKKKISGFSSSKIERILAVQPDLVIGFCDLQADICRDLAHAGIEVHIFNQRTIAGIFHMIRVLAALVERQESGRQLVANLQKRIDQTRAQSARWTQRPLVYFEEWDMPLISGIGWVAELIDIAGGEDAFPALSAQAGAAGRIIADPQDVVRRAPEIIIGSWCGKKFRPESLYARPGWETIPAMQNGLVFEIKSPDILVPGPAAITLGLVQLQRAVERWQNLRA